MRGEDRGSQGFFSYVRLEERIAADHPLRAIRDLIDEALRKLSPSFSRLYAREGRPSIPPERLLRALLLQAFYTVRSERQLMEQLDYNLLFRWFVGLSSDDPVWDATVFCKNRDRLLNGDIARKFMTTVLNLPQVRSLLSSEHFSVDGTLIEAWASMKSFVHREFLRFLKTIDERTLPNLDLHLIVDNYATHKTPAVKRWLKRHSRFHLHFTPTSGSWLNMVERFFAEITRKRIRRGVFKSVDEWKQSIMDYLDKHNGHPKPYVWTKTAAEIFSKVVRAKQALESQH